MRFVGEEKKYLGGDAAPPYLEMIDTFDCTRFLCRLWLSAGIGDSVNG
jgi:hypothetical protein